MKESIGTFDVTVQRKKGASGQVALGYQTADINAVEEKDYIGICSIQMFDTLRKKSSNFCEKKVQVEF